MSPKRKNGTPAKEEVTHVVFLRGEAGCREERGGGRLV